MSQIDKVKAEIERLKEENARMKWTCNSMAAYCKEEAYNEILSFIDSLDDKSEEQMTKRERDALVERLTKEIIDKLKSM